MTLAVCGGSGFVGRHLLDALACQGEPRIHLLAHDRDLSTDFTASNAKVVRGDLENPASLTALVSGVSTVVNLAYLVQESRDANQIAIANLVRACKSAKVRRLVHLSTAVVVGDVSADVITELTPPEPLTDYERTKLEVERTLLDEAADAFELIILRPTAVFGPGGRNLVKLASSLCTGSGMGNYVRSCLQGRRRMNLLCVENAVAAILFATTLRIDSRTETFIVSDDDERVNNYRDVESMLRRALGCGEYAVPPPALPSPVLRTLLRLAGRSNTNPSRVYSGAKIAAAGFRKVVSLDAGLALFADWFRKTHPGAGDSIG